MAEHGVRKFDDSVGNLFRNSVQEMTEFADQGIGMMVSDQKSIFSEKPEIKFNKIDSANALPILSVNSAKGPSFTYSNLYHSKIAHCVL